MGKRKKQFWDARRPQSQSWSEFLQTQMIQEKQKRMQLQCEENGNREIIEDDELPEITRIEQKMNSERATLRQKEFYKKSTALGEQQFKESCALMKNENAERTELLKTVRRENPETQKAVRDFTDGIIQTTLTRINKDDAEKNKLYIQAMANRHATADNETRERLSFWQQFQEPPKKVTGKISTATQKSLARRGQLSTATPTAPSVAIASQPPRAKSPEEFVRVESPTKQHGLFSQNAGKTQRHVDPQKPTETGLLWKILGYK